MSDSKPSLVIAELQNVREPGQIRTYGTPLGYIALATIAIVAIDEINAGRLGWLNIAVVVAAATLLIYTVGLFGDVFRKFYFQNESFHLSEIDEGLQQFEAVKDKWEKHDKDEAMVACLLDEKVQQLEKAEESLSRANLVGLATALVTFSAIVYDHINFGKATDLIVLAAIVSMGIAYLGANAVNAASLADMKRLRHFVARLREMDKPG